MLFWAHIVKYLRSISVRTGKKTLMPPASIILHSKRGLATSHALLFQKITKDQGWNPVLCCKDNTIMNCGPKARRCDMGAAFLWSLRHSERTWWIIVWNFTIIGIEQDAKLYWVGWEKRDSISSLFRPLPQTSRHMGRKDGKMILSQWER